MRKIRLAAACAAVALCLVEPVAAHATAINLLGQFNAIIFGSFTSSADVEGRTVIGGDMTGGATFALKPLTGQSSFAALTVYGSETSSGYFNIDRGGGLSVQGSNRGNFNLNGSGDVVIGGSNSGTLQNSGGAGASIGIGGANSGTLSLNNGGSVTVGGSNAGQITVSNGNGSVTMLGSNSAQVTLNSGGSVYVGSANTGNVSTSNGSSGVAVNGSNAAQITMNSGGAVQINGDTGNVSLNGGSLTYAGSITGNINANSGAKVTKGSVSLTAPVAPNASLPNFASTFQTPLMQLSTQLAGMTSNSSVQTSGNHVTLSARPNASGEAVLDIGSGLFAGNTTMSIALNGATSFIVNVTIPGCGGSSGCALDLPSSLNFEDPTSYAAEVLWNFTDATSLDFPNEFGGTVLSPYATVTNHNAIDGTLVAAQYDGQGELHSYPFTGSVASTAPESVSRVAVPEPSSLGLLLPGLAWLGWRNVRRRRV